MLVVMLASACSVDESSAALRSEIDAVVWFSDLCGFTRITDATPEQVIPLLNDYADVIVSAIHEHGGDCSS